MKLCEKLRALSPKWKGTAVRFALIAASLFWTPPSTLISAAGPDAWLVLTSDESEKEVIRLPLKAGEPFHLDYINSIYRQPVRESFRYEQQEGLFVFQVETPSLGVFEYLGLRPETPGRALVRHKLGDIRLLSSDYRNHHLTVGGAVLGLKGLVPDGRVLILRVVTDRPHAP